MTKESPRCSVGPRCNAQSQKFDSIQKASLKLENIENQLIRTLKEVIGFFLIMNSTFLIIEKTLKKTFAHFKHES